MVNRMSEPPLYAIAPIDRCYKLVGLVKARWEGISGGAGGGPGGGRATSTSCARPRRCA